MKHKLKQATAAVLFIVLFLGWGIIYAAIQGVEVEQTRAIAGKRVSDFNDMCLENMTHLATAASLQRIGEALNIDRVLASYNSPLAGYGIIFVHESRRTGIPAELPAAIAGKESYWGHLCFAPHNAWGMLAYRGGFSSWEEGIRANFDWLYRYYGAVQGPHGCGGYCVPNHPWMEDVAANMGLF